MTKEQEEVDPQKIEQFISKVINDLGATSNVALAFIEINLVCIRPWPRLKVVVV